MNFPEIPGIAFWYTDLVTGKAFWSKEMYNIYGLPLDKEPAVDLFMTYVHIDDHDRIIEAVHEGTRTLKPFSFLHKTSARAGSPRMLFSFGDFDFLNGKPIYRYGITLDFTGFHDEKIIEAIRHLHTFILPGVATLNNANSCKPFIERLQEIISNQ